MNNTKYPKWEKQFTQSEHLKVNSIDSQWQNVFADSNPLEDDQEECDVDFEIDSYEIIVDPIKKKQQGVVSNILTTKQIENDMDYTLPNIAHKPGSDLTQNTINNERNTRQSTKTESERMADALNSYQSKVILRAYPWLAPMAVKVIEQHEKKESFERYYADQGVSQGQRELLAKRAYMEKNANRKPPKLFSEDYNPFW